MKKIIIDTDPGIDDVFAISLAVLSEDLLVEGITTVDGNCNLEYTTRNALKALELCHREDIPVYKGSPSPIYKREVDATRAHGNNGLGGLDFELKNNNIGNLNAIDYIISTVNENPNEITIVTTGPLTNIAKAIAKDESFVKNVKSLIIMGGSINKGNITPYAEFNFYKDPEAAKIVFAADFNEIIMIGLDVTNKLALEEKYKKLLNTIDDEKAKFFYDIVLVKEKFDREVNKLAGAILHDPIVISYLLDNNIVELKNAIVKIDIKGKTTGKSNVEFVEESNCKVAYNVDVDKFYKILFKNIFKVDIN